MPVAARSTKKGFTLIEILIVITIIAILAAIGMVTYNVFLKNARDTRRQTDLRLIQSALEKYHADQKYYPVSVDFSKSLKSPTGVIYLSTFPNDPNSLNTYLYESYTTAVGPDGKFSTTPCPEDISCFRYCLYAKLETPFPSPSPGLLIDRCPDESGYNFKVTSSE